MCLWEVPLPLLLSHVFLDNDAFLFFLGVLPLKITAVDLKSNNQDVTEVQLWFKGFHEGNNRRKQHLVLNFRWSLTSKDFSSKYQKQSLFLKLLDCQITFDHLILCVSKTYDSNPLSQSKYLWSCVCISVKAPLMLGDTCRLWSTLCLL